MAHYRTAYEVTAAKGDQVCLVAYTKQVSRSGLLKAMQRIGPQIIAKLAIGQNDQISFACQPRVHAVMDGWTIGFTGRTALEAKRNEYPSIS